MSKVIITGANGFIGSHVAMRFHELGHEVYGLDINKGVERPYNTIQVDLFSDQLRQIIQDIQPDIIVHCAGAADVPRSEEDPGLDYDINTSLVHHLLTVLVHLNMMETRVIQLSSAAVYGEPSSLPIKEKAGIHPLSPYAMHKRLAEEICEFYSIRYGMPIKVLRIFSAYGPGLKKQIFSDMYRKYVRNGCLEMLGTGDESRDYIYIDDLAQAIVKIALSENEAFDIINVASGVETRIKEAVNIFANEVRLSPSQVVFSNHNRACDPKNWCADISKMKEYGCVPEVNIEEGIHRYVDWANKFYFAD